MKTIDRLILKSYLGPMVLSFFIVMFVLMMNFMWKYIDELVGKGLDTGVIAELMMYASITMIPMGLPLATLFAAIMTMGNLGENYELLAMKSAGMSLPRIMRSLIIVIGIIAVGSFFVTNNLVPYSTRQMQALLYDIRQQRQSIEFQDGIFFNGIDNMSIRVGRQHPSTHLLTDVLLYDTRQGSGNMNTTVADSGYISMSEDKRNLLVTLYNGVQYEQTRDYGSLWYDENALRRNYFTEQYAIIALDGFDFSRTDSELFSGSQTKNVAQLQYDIDSLKIEVDNMTSTSYDPLFRNYLFVYDNTIYVDNLREITPHVKPFLLTGEDLADYTLTARNSLWQNALSNAQNSRGAVTWDEDQTKEYINQLYRAQAEWHRKVSLPFSIMIFFLIGAPLGAIIRKGGLGMPIVISVVFFVLYYIISIAGEKMAKEGTLTSFEGMWISTLVLLPIAVFLTYKATNDSNLFNSEWYIMQYRKLKGFIQKHIKEKKNDAAEASA